MVGKGVSKIIISCPMNVGIKTCSSTKLRVSLVLLGVFNVYCGNEGKVISRKFFVLLCCGCLIYSRVVPGLVGNG